MGQACDKNAINSSEVIYISLSFFLLWSNFSSERSKTLFVMPIKHFTCLRTKEQLSSPNFRSTSCYKWCLLNNGSSNKNSPLSTTREKAGITEGGLYISCGQIVNVVGNELVCRIRRTLSEP